MPELPKDQARVLRALYEWCFVGRGEGASRSRLERVPDYVLAAELDDSGVDARACLDVLVTRGLARRLGRGDSGGTWTLPGGRVLRVSLRQTGEGPARLFYADVYVQDPGGPWRPIVELAGIEPCGTVFDLTPAGVDAAEQLPNSPAARFGAGAAFMRAVEHDPEAQAALKRAQARLRAFAEALKDPEIQRELERSRREQEQAFQALADAIRESVRAAQQDLGDLGFMSPKTLEDWEHLARVVEMPFEAIQAGNFTARDVYVMALAWMDRQRMLSQLKRDGDRPQSKTASERSPAGAIGFTVAALRDMTGLGNNALNRYAKTANVTTPRRGERDFKYTLADVRAILETIIASTAEDKLRDRCKSALRNLPEIAD